MAILVFRFRHVEDGDHRRGNDEDRGIGKVTSRTDPLASPKSQRERRVVSDAPVFVEKTLGLEFFRVWVQFWVVQDRPETTSGTKYTDG
jgi:hypothetical protein